MKQHITRKQLIEADIDKLEALTNIPTLYDYPEKLTIGKMIEILDDSGECIDISNGNSIGRYSTGYEIWVGNIGVMRDSELCDSLWELVKYILK